MNISSGIFKENLYQEELGKFITFPGERVIVGIREHYVPLLFRILKILLVVFSAVIGVSIITFAFVNNFFLMVIASLLIAFAGSSFILQELVHWYFHLYIVTDRKILEIKYHPLISETTNSVLLDQIKCTEIDAEVYGFIPELLDMGDVKITFDRPTHQEEFVLRGIRSPRRISNLLSSELNKDHGNNEEQMQQIWFKNRAKNRFQFINERRYGAIN